MRTFLSGVPETGSLPKHNVVKALCVFLSYQVYFCCAEALELKGMPQDIQDMNNTRKHLALQMAYEVYIAKVMDLIKEKMDVLIELRKEVGEKKLVTLKNKVLEKGEK